MHLFDKQLSVSGESVDLLLHGFTLVAWAEHMLNPRRLRGSDFLMRWSQGVWSERRLVEALGATHDYFAIPYGPSGTAPDEDVRAFELYFERLEAAGLGAVKRPDLMVFRKDAKQDVEALLGKLGGLAELPFISEDNPDIKALLSYAVVAVECENSLWRGQQMPDFGAELRPQKRLHGKFGLKKSAVLPTVIIKDEDLEPLLIWQSANHVPIHVWHVFYDLAFGLSLNRATELLADGLIEPTAQTFQAPNGITTTKTLYKFYYHYAYSLGKAITDPQLVADSITDKNGHILPFVRFEGGTLQISHEATTHLDRLSQDRELG